MALRWSRIGVIAPQVTGNLTVCWKLVGANIKENIKDPHSQVLCGGPLMAPLTKRRLYGKHFHVMTSSCLVLLIYWGRVTHTCVSKLNTIGSDNGLSPGRRQAIIWSNAGILLIGPLRTKLNEILIEIYTFSFKKMHLKMSSGSGGHFVSTSLC